MHSSPYARAEVARGEVVALLGPNGAGKTTTIEILEGFRMPSDGEVKVLGADPSGWLTMTWVLLLGLAMMLPIGIIGAARRPDRADDVGVARCRTRD